MKYRKLSGLLLGLALAATAAAQSYSEKPIKLVVPYATARGSLC